MMHRNDRRRFLGRLLAGVGTVFLSGCDQLSRTQWITNLLSTDEHLSYRAHRLLSSRKSMAQEFSEADLSPSFRSNGTSLPNNPQYLALAKNGFSEWVLEIGGMVERPLKFTLAQLHGLPSRTQITRHDCVEGWSAIGKWTGVPLHEVLSLVRPLSQARYLV